MNRLSIRFVHSSKRETQGRGAAGFGSLLARTCRISALTVKKAYDVLEREGLVVTVQGKGSFVAQISPNIVAEELNRQVEEQFAQAIAKARRLGLTREEILELVVMLLEDTSADSGDAPEGTEGAS